MIRVFLNFDTIKTISNDTQVDCNKSNSIYKLKCKICHKDYIGFEDNCLHSELE